MRVTLNSGGQNLPFEGKMGSIVRGFHPLEVGQEIKSIGILEEEGRVVGEYEGRLYVAAENGKVTGIQCRNVREILGNYRIVTKLPDVDWLLNLQENQKLKQSSSVEWHCTIAMSPSILLDTNKITSSFWASMMPNDMLMFTKGDHQSLVVLYGGLLDGCATFDVIGWSVSNFSLKVPSVCNHSEHPVVSYNPIKLFIQIGPLSQEVGMGANVASFITQHQLIKLADVSENVRQDIWTSVAFNSNLQQPETAKEAATRYWIETAHRRCG